MTRMWHYDLVDSLPSKWLVSQFRECVGITNQMVAGTLNHAIVNRVKDYPLEHLSTYNQLVVNEFNNRQFKMNEKSMKSLLLNNANLDLVEGKMLLQHWHNERYLDQCHLMLQEKFDVGMILEKDWLVLDEKYKKLKEEF